MLLRDNYYKDSIAKAAYKAKREDGKKWQPRANSHGVGILRITNIYNLYYRSGCACWCPNCSPSTLILRRPDGSIARDWFGTSIEVRLEAMNDPRFLGLLRVGDRVRFNYSIAENLPPYVIHSIEDMAITVRRFGHQVDIVIQRPDIERMYPSGD